MAITRHRPAVLILLICLISAGLQSAQIGAQDEATGFSRIATYSVYENNEDPSAETVAEIVSVSADGMTLAYSDGALGAVGLVDITDPANPAGLGSIEVGGEPTSVAFLGNLVLVGVNTSESFTEPSGHLAVVDASTSAVVAEFALDGQPDSVAVAPSGNYAAIVIENERDEDLDTGEPPQLPAGSLQFIETSGAPEEWAATLQTVDLTGIADLFGEDPEPEFVDINHDDIAAVSLQENNHLITVDLTTGEVQTNFNLGAVDLENVDATEDDVISLTESIAEVPREPDAISWLPGGRIATANEGDLFGGSRGFSVFSEDGELLYDSASSFEELAVRHGHYPEARSENKGSEPEAIEYGQFAGTDYLFVGSERGSFLAAYSIGDDSQPHFEQFLPAGLGPEGVLAVPSRDLLIVSSEVDEPDFGVRATIMFFEYGANPDVPDVVSADNDAGSPIPWSAMSGLSAVPGDPSTLVAVQDSFYSENRIFTIDVSNPHQAVVTDAITIVDQDGEPTSYDPEGIASTLTGSGSYWMVSEGAASVDADDPTVFSSTENLLMLVDANGVVQAEIGLPAHIEACRQATIADTEADRGFRRAVRFGFEGVTVDPDTGVVWIANQREWIFSDVTVTVYGDTEVDCSEFSGEEGITRLWGFDWRTGQWNWVDYELAPKPESASWVGLSEITALGNGGFVLIERDNRTGDFAEIKTVVHLSDLTTATTSISADDKGVFDMLPALLADNGWISDKPEGLAVTEDGQVYVITDNDGVDDWSGETWFLRLGALDELNFE